MDLKRTKLIETILGCKLRSYICSMSAFNCKFLSHEEIVQAIIRLMEMRKMI